MRIVFIFFANIAPSSSGVVHFILRSKSLQINLEIVEVFT